MPFQMPVQATYGARHTQNWKVYDTTGGAPPGTGAWVNGKLITRPLDWDEVLHLLYPTGSQGYPLSALITKMSKKPAVDPEFNWFSKTLPSQEALNTGVYIDAALTTAYGGGGLVGDVIYIKTSLTDIQHFRDGHEVMIVSPTDSLFMLRGKVVGVAQNGVNSFLAINLLEADVSSLLTNAGTLGLSTIVIGDINPEYGAMPGNLLYEPIKFTNYTQIFREPLRISRTALQSAYRIGSKGDYQEAHRETLERHSIQKEKAWFFGLPTERMGANGMPERTTAGLTWFISNFGGLVADFRTINVPELVIPAGATWINWGGRFMDYCASMIFRYGGMGGRLAFCGFGALAGINSMIKYGPNSNYTINTGMTSYGINVTELITPFGKLNFVLHPLWGNYAHMRNTMYVVSMEDLQYRALQDTKFYDDNTDRSLSHARLDGIAEEYLTEAGLAMYNPVKFGIINGIGLDRP